MDIQEMQTGWFCPFRVPSGTHETDRAVVGTFHSAGDQRLR